MFYSGFDLLAGLYPSAVASLYNAFFASLMVMLLFSSGIIMYTNLYRSPEAAFLLTTPARPERIFSYLFQEAMWFSSWGFLLLGSPMLVAAGVVVGAPWHYYALLLPFMLSFLYIPAALGAILCLLIVDRLGGFVGRRCAGLRAAVAVGLLWLGWSVLNGGQSDLLTPRWFQEFRAVAVHGKSAAAELVAEHRIARSGPAADGGLVRRSSLVGEHHVSRPADFQRAAVSSACRLVRRARLSRQALAECRPSKRRGGGRKIGIFDRLLLGRFGGSGRPPSHLRLLLVKELRLFRRDPVQWSQSLIFFGLLALYFVNIRRFSYNATYSAMIGFLNLGVVGLILSTFTTRFIFPMLSLEGRRFWILALLPVRRDTVVWTKFVFRRRRLAASLLRIDAAQRRHARHQLADSAGASDFMRGALPGTVGHRRRPGSEDAGTARAESLEDRGRLRRHVEPGAQRRVHRRDRDAHGGAVSLLSDEHPRPRAGAIGAADATARQSRPPSPPASR